jgi:nickel/cobalt exporter
MGNLSVNRYSRLEPDEKGIGVTYVLDLAEIPTFELMQSWNVPRGASKSVLESHARQQSREWVANLVFSENGKPLIPRIESTDLTMLDGGANLPVFRVVMRLRVPAAGGRIEYEDRNYPARAGWREIVIKPGGGAEVSRASNSDTELSQALTVFPPDASEAPPGYTRAWLEWKPVAGHVTQSKKPVIVAETQPSTPAAAPTSEPARDTRPPATNRNDSISAILKMKTISWPLFATLLGLSFWFGALHALEPGHGKTMVAAYLVGERGNAKHAALLGGMVTFTHTVSVFILGLLTLFLSKYIMPDRISKVLGIISGLTIVWIGAMLLYRRSRGLVHSNVHHHHHHDQHHHDHPHTHTHDHPHTHAHDHPHEHHHHPHSHGPLTHTHDGHTHTHAPEGEISLKSLIALGASGGLVPCPSALILLLSAISIGRVGLGMVLLAAFSLGLAIVLTATGMLVLYAKNLLPEGKRANNPFFRYMPVFSAAAILLIGVLMTGVSLGWVPASRFIG